MRAIEIYQQHQDKDICGSCGCKSKDVEAFEKAFKNCGNVKSQLVEDFKSVLKFFKIIR